MNKKDKLNNKVAVSPSVPLNYSTAASGKREAENARARHVCPRCGKRWHCGDFDCPITVEKNCPECFFVQQR